jgi:hypothetical protein
MKRAEILDTAKALTTADRANAYGSAERNFSTIAAFWAAYLEHPITAADVAVMMTMVKCARIKVSPAHLDSWVDGAGYLALGGEIATEDAE